MYNKAFHNNARIPFSFFEANSKKIKDAGI